MAIPRSCQPAATTTNPVVTIARKADHTQRLNSTPSAFPMLGRASRHPAAFTGRKPFALKVAHGATRSFFSRLSTFRDHTLSGNPDTTALADEAPELTDRFNKRVALHMA